MFVLVWVTLLFAVRSSNAGTDTNKSGETLTKQGNTLKLTCSADGSGLRDNTGMATFVIPCVAAESSVQYICKATHQNDTTMKEVNGTVTHLKTPEKNGKEGDNLNLTPNADIKNLQHGTETDTTSDTLVCNVTADVTGQYICTAQQLNTNVAILYQKISSGCTNQSGVLTCTCISQGFPLPTIKWIVNHIVHSIITTVSGHMIKSTITLNVADQSHTGVMCTSDTVEEEAKEGYLKTILRIVTQLETIIAFLTGILLSSVTCCFMRKCQRKKKRTKENLADTGGLEMVTCDADLLIYAGHAVEGNQAIDQEAAEAAGAAEAAETAEAGGAGKSDVEYSNLDFSLIKERQDATGETTETEYAEIKKAMPGQDGEGMEEDQEPGHCPPVVEEEEDVALYSTVKDIMEDGFNEDSVG